MANMRPTQSYQGIAPRKRVEGIENLMRSADLSSITTEIDKKLTSVVFLELHIIRDTTKSVKPNIISDIQPKLHSGAIDPQRTQRSIFERNILNNHILQKCVRIDMELQDMLEVVARAYYMEAEVGIERVAGVGLANSHGNLEIIFISSDELRFLKPQLRALSKSHGSEFLRAILTFFTIVHYHPYADGNGRIARTMFNLILRRAGLCDSQYLPLFDIMHSSKGEYELALRHAELFGSWKPLVKFMASAFEIARAQ